MRNTIDEKTIEEYNKKIQELVSLINGDVTHYLLQGVNYFTVTCGNWEIKYDKFKYSIIEELNKGGNKNGKNNSRNFG